MPEYEDKIPPKRFGFKPKKRPTIKRHSKEATKSNGYEIPRITSIEQIPPAFRMRFKTNTPGEYDTELEPPSEPFDILDDPAYQISFKRNDGGIDKRFVPASEPVDILDDPAYRIPLKTNDPENPETTVYDAFIKPQNQIAANFTKSTQILEDKNLLEKGVDVEEIYEDEDDEIMDLAVRITEDKLHYLEWKDENPFDLEKEEIWLVQSSAEKQVVLKGEDLRYLLQEARRLWLENYDSYLEELRTWVWQREEENNVFIDENGFHVVNDPNGTLTQFLLTFGDPKDKEEVDAMFAPDGKGFNEPSFNIYRDRDPDELIYPAWQENNPWDLEKDEIWTIYDKFNSEEEAIKGEDLRHLIGETRALWLQWQKFKRKQQKAWWNPF